MDLKRRASSKEADPFDFDAPRFTDFCRAKYRETKRLLDKTVLKTGDTDEHSSLEEAEFNSFMSSELSDGWFDRVHQSHEPSSPPPPCGGLLSDGSSSSGPPNTPLPSFMPPPSFMSPNVSVMRPGGKLGAKPGRILLAPDDRRSSPSSCHEMMMLSSDRLSSAKRRRTPMASVASTPRLMPTSPIARRQGMALESEDQWTDGRISSLPSLEGWMMMSSPKTPVLLPSPMRIDSNAQLDCPPLAATAAAPIRKLGLGSRAARVQLPVQDSTASKQISPTVKRIRVEPAAFTASTHPLHPPKKQAPVKIEDLKKILAEHNQRLRPRKR